jgi:DNA-binding MarR family transcriptional regulator
MIGRADGGNMIDKIPREVIDQVLSKAMAAVYQFEQQKVQRFGMTSQDSYLLCFLRKHAPVRMGDIAAELSAHISTASRAVDRLAKRRLVSRNKDPEDKRSVLVSLEPVGEKLMKSSEDHSYRTIKKGMQGYSDEEFTAIMKAAANLNAILGVPPLDAKVPPKNRIRRGGMK